MSRIILTMYSIEQVSSLLLSLLKIGSFDHNSIWKHVAILIACGMHGHHWELLALVGAALQAHHYFMAFTGSTHEE